MVANHEVSDKQKKGTPSTASQEIGSNGTQQERWMEALDKEKAMLAEIGVMEQAMSRMVSRMEAAREERIKIKHEIAGTALLPGKDHVNYDNVANYHGVGNNVENIRVVDDNVVKYHVDENNVVNSSQAIQELGRMPRQGNDEKSTPLKGLELPDQDASMSKTGGRYNYSQNNGEDMERNTLYVKVDVEGLQGPLSLKYEVMQGLNSSDLVVRESAEHEFKEQVAMQIYQEQRMARSLVNDSFYYFDTPDSGNTGWDKVEHEEEMHPRTPLPNSGPKAAYTAPIGSSWRTEKGSRDESVVAKGRSSKLDPVMEPDDEEKDDPSSSDSSDGDGEQSDDDVRKKKKKKKTKVKLKKTVESDEVLARREKLRRSRKAAPDPKLCAALIKGVVKLKQMVTTIDRG